MRPRGRNHQLGFVGVQQSLMNVSDGIVTNVEAHLLLIGLFAGWERQPRHPIVEHPANFDVAPSDREAPIDDVRENQLAGIGRDGGMTQVESIVENLAAAEQLSRRKVMDGHFTRDVRTGNQPFAFWRDGDTTRQSPRRKSS